MATELENLNMIKTKIADVHADVKAKLEDVRAEVSPEGQAAFDEVLTSLDTFDAEIGDADGSDTPAAGEPAPTDEPAPVVGPDNATDESGTPVDADGNPLR